MNQISFKIIGYNGSCEELKHYTDLVADLWEHGDHMAG